MCGGRMLRRMIIGIVLLSVCASASAVEPFMLLLLRMARDKAISASIERGVGALTQTPATPAPLYGYALPIEPIAKGTEEQRLRAVIDESFLHLTSEQRNAVFTGMQKILNDPQHAHNKPMIVAEFAIKAIAIRDGYRVLDRLSVTEKRQLAVQARNEFKRLPAGERRQMLDALQSGALPMPRDLNAIMLAELGAEQRRLE
jgi:hypothetical protein